MGSLILHGATYKYAYAWTHHHHPSFTKCTPPFTTFTTQHLQNMASFCSTMAAPSQPQPHALPTFTMPNASTNDDEDDASSFPSFLPPQVQYLKDKAARIMAKRICRLPVQTSLAKQPIMTSCVVPHKFYSDTPLLLLHGFDSSCLEWRYSYPLLEAADIECWVVDILGWGFNQSDGLPSYSVTAKREHLYEFWRLHIKKPVVLVGASLGGATAIDFSLAHPEAVSKLILIDAQGYAEGTGSMASFPKLLAYLGVALLKSRPLRLYANLLIYGKHQVASILDAVNIGRLHCLMPGWADASVDFMLSGGYNISARVPEVQKETLVIWGKEDKILNKDLAEKFRKDIPSAKVVYISNSGHLPHVEKPKVVVSLIEDFMRT